MQAASGKTVLTGATGIAVAPIIVWVLGLFGVDIPAEVAAAIAGLLSAAVAYFVPAKSGKYVATVDDVGWDRRIDGSMADYAAEEPELED